MQTVHRVILLACFSVWFGGFFFYVSIVVPIGTDVLGSTTAQGMITRRVTEWLNLVNGLALATMFLETILRWRFNSRSIRVGQVVICVLMLGGLIWLVYLHPILDGMIDPEEQEVTDSGEFYGLHRVYLWVSTFQWVASCVWLFLLVWSWRDKNLSDIQDQVSERVSLE